MPRDRHDDGDACLGKGGIGDAHILTDALSGEVLVDDAADLIKRGDRGEGFESREGLAHERVEAAMPSDDLRQLVKRRANVKQSNESVGGSGALRQSGLDRRDLGKTGWAKLREEEFQSVGHKRAEGFERGRQEDVDVECWERF
ncbi:MAG: hypothetical protein AMXMBFR20_13660 [Planctomycetia bacterium]